MHVDVASAGHPLPLLLRKDGSVEPVGIEGTLVGVVPDPDLADASAHLDAGDSLVFYTDGVTEARNADRDAGRGRASRRCSPRARAWTRTPSRRRSRSAAVEMQEGETRDDIAVVVLAGRRKCWESSEKWVRRPPEWKRLSP